MDDKSKGTVVFFSFDALGHIHPILSLAAELRRRNYRSIILTTRPLDMAPKLRALGLELEHCEEQTGALSGAQSEEALRAVMQPLTDLFRKGLPTAYEATYRIDGAAGKHLDDMIAKHDIIEAKLIGLKPDLIVYDHIIGVPCVTRIAPVWVRMYSGYMSAIYSSYNDNYVAGLGLALDQMTSERKSFERRVKVPLREKIRRFWSEKGEPDWPRELDLTPTSPHLNFYLGPQELGLDQVQKFKPLPDVWFRLEHTIPKPKLASEFSLPKELEDLPGKLIYFSLGTLVTSDIDLINRLLRILSNSPNRFIVSKGQMHKHIKLFPNMWGDKFVDQQAVLSKVDLFITHGGHNSIIESFYYGVPGLIVLPVFADQFDSAQRIHDCGFGRRLNPYECSEEELLGSISSLLADTALRQRMRDISARLQSIKYHELAVDKLEKLMGH